MEKITKYWKVLKEIGLVIMFVGGAVFSYGQYTTDEAVHDLDVSIEYTSLKEDNKILLKEIVCIKSELKTIKTDYRILKLKLFKSNIIDDFGGFVTTDDGEHLPKDTKRAAYEELVVSFRNDDRLDGTVIK